jgi:hypothetical protein
MVHDDDSVIFISWTGHRITEKMDETDALLPYAWRIRPEDFDIEKVLLYLDILERGPVPLILELEELNREQRGGGEPSGTE